jgi:hypothetical protein
MKTCLVLLPQSISGMAFMKWIKGTYNGKDPIITEEMPEHIWYHTSSRYSRLEASTPHSARICIRSLNAYYSAADVRPDRVDEYDEEGRLSWWWAPIEGAPTHKAAGEEF